MRTKSRIAERLQNMSPVEMQERWYTLRGRYLRFLIFFVSAAAILFTSNRIQHFDQGVVNIINVAFQICCVFVVLFGMLGGVSLFYGRRPAKETN